MKVNVLYFAALREALGTDREAMETGARTVGELRAQLRARGGVWAEKLADGRNVRMAVNQAMAGADAAIVEGAEIAFFPPVTGG